MIVSLGGGKICDYYVFARPDAEYGARLASLKVNTLADQEYHARHIQEILTQYGIKKSVIIHAPRHEDPLQKAQDDGLIRARAEDRYFDAAQFAKAEQHDGRFDTHITLSHAYRLDLTASTHYLQTDFKYVDNRDVYDVHGQTLGYMHHIQLDPDHAQHKALTLSSDMRVYWRERALDFMHAGQDIVLLHDTHDMTSYGRTIKQANARPFVMPFVA
jgi:hypothetical protein